MGGKGKLTTGILDAQSLSMYCNICLSNARHTSGQPAYDPISLTIPLSEPTSQYGRQAQNSWYIQMGTH